jgi:hypothetical protein
MLEFCLLNPPPHQPTHFDRITHLAFGRSKTLTSTKASPLKTLATEAFRVPQFMWEHLKIKKIESVISRRTFHLSCQFCNADYLTVYLKLHLIRRTMTLASMTGYLAI